MSLSVLEELRLETRRLFIAGSGLASGDRGLERQLPRLEQLGETSPVFRRIGDGVRAVLAAPREESAPRLLELAGLIHSVLATQGKTEPEGATVPLAGGDVRPETAVSYRRLQPLLEALTSRGQGRLEAVRSAHEEGLTRDFRVLPAAVAGLDDPYPELADYLAANVIPAYGRAALSSLRGQFRLEGGKSDGRRLELIHGILGREGLALYEQAAREGAPEVRAAAIRLLGGYPEQEEFLLALADEKRKDLRAAALEALARIGSERAQDRLFAALVSRDRELAVQPIRQNALPELARRVARQAEETLDRFLVDPAAAKAAKAAEELHTYLWALADKGAAVPEVDAFLRRLAAAPGFRDEAERVQTAAIVELLSSGRPEDDDFILGLERIHPDRYIPYRLRAAHRRLSPAEVFDRFAPLLAPSKAKGSNLPRGMLVVELREYRIPSWEEQVLYRPEEAQAELLRWDPRWAPALAAAGELELASRLALRPDAALKTALCKQLDAKAGFHDNLSLGLMLALFRMGDPEAPERLMRLAEQGGGRARYYLTPLQRTALELLPAAYAERLRQLAERYASSGIRQEMLEIAETISAKPESPSSDEGNGKGLWAWIKQRMS